MMGHISTCRLIMAAHCAALLIALFTCDATYANADSRDDELAARIDQLGREAFGQLPLLCDDLTFVRRIYLDTLGRIPSLSEVSDFQSNGKDRRRNLIRSLVFGEGDRGDLYKRLNASHMARLWRRILLPAGTTIDGNVDEIEGWLRESFETNKPYDELIRELIRVGPDGPGTYFNMMGASPEKYAGQMSRIALGVRIECAQCHDHPFASWKQADFWGLAAFYSDLGSPNSSVDNSNSNNVGRISSEGKSYVAKYLGTNDAAPVPFVDAETKSADDFDEGMKLRRKFARWVTSRDNPHFSATAVNRVWQHLVGKGVYTDVENLDAAKPEERALLDKLGEQFEAVDYDLRILVAAIFKSQWYQAECGDRKSVPSKSRFSRSMKVLSPEQVFDSLELALLLPVSRIDPNASRWTGERMQLISRLNETSGSNPEDFVAGIPQALMLMNGKVVGDAIDWERSRLLRAVVEAPFMNESARLESLYMSILTRVPTKDELDQLSQFIQSQSSRDSQQRAFGEILWALLNSSEFVLCR